MNTSTSNPSAPNDEGRRSFRAFSLIGLGCFSAFAINIGLSYLASWLVSEYAPELRNSPYFLWGLQIIVQYVIAMPVGMLIIKNSHREKAALGCEKLNAGKLAVIFICCYPMMYAGNIIGQFFNSIILALSGNTSSSGLSDVLSTGPWWLPLLVSVIIAPVMEELFFRGVLMKALRPWGARTAIFGSALAFGLFHGNLEQFFYALLLGIIFGNVYQRTGKLHFTIILHMLINFISGMIPTLLINGIFGSVDMDKFLNDYISASSGEDMAETVKVFEEYSDVFSGLPYLWLYLSAVLGLCITGLVLIRVFRQKLSPLPDDGIKIRRDEIGSTVFLAPGVMLFLLSAAAWIIFGIVYQP